PDPSWRLASALSCAPQSQTRQRRSESERQPTGRVIQAVAAHFFSPRSVARLSETVEPGLEVRYPGLLKGKPARVERCRPELGLELLERRDRVLGEHILDHP